MACTVWILLPSKWPLFELGVKHFDFSGCGSLPLLKSGLMVTTPFPSALIVHNKHSFSFWPSLRNTRIQCHFSIPELECTSKLLHTKQCNKCIGYIVVFDLCYSLARWSQVTHDVHGLYRCVDHVAGLHKVLRGLPGNQPGLGEGAVTADQQNTTKTFCIQG